MTPDEREASQARRSGLREGIGDPRDAWSEMILDILNDGDALDAALSADDDGDPGWNLYWTGEAKEPGRD